MNKRTIKARLAWAIYREKVYNEDYPNINNLRMLAHDLGFDPGEIETQAQLLAVYNDQGLAAWCLRNDIDQTTLHM